MKTFLVPACCLLCVALQAFAQEDDFTVSEIEQRKQISQQAADLLRAYNFAELEKTAEDFRTNKSRLPSGLWKLYYFYVGIESPRNSTTGSDWTAHLERLEKWRMQYPQSITVYTALAEAYMRYAWQARGNGVAGTVPEEGWRLFRERMNKAEEYVVAARKLPATDPQLDYVELSVGGEGLSWDWPRYNAVFSDAVKREPQYVSLYVEKAWLCLPRWHGKPGDVERFALEAVRLTQSTEGKAMYARLAVFLRKTTPKGSRFFDVYHFSWPDVRDGFRDLEKQYPHSLWNLNQFCCLATHANDAKTANELFDRIGDRWDGDVWGDEGVYRAWKRWVGSQSAQPSGSVGDAQ
jgi:hypothetical protein